MRFMRQPLFLFFGLTLELRNGAKVQRRAATVEGKTVARATQKM